MEIWPRAVAYAGSPLCDVTDGMTVTIDNMSLNRVLELQLRGNLAVHYELETYHSRG